MMCASSCTHTTRPSRAYRRYSSAERLARRLRSLVRGEHTLSIVGMQELRRRATGPRPTPRPSSRAWPRSEGSCRRSSSTASDPIDVDGEWKLLDERAVAGLGQPYGIVGSLSLGDVECEPLSERHSALRRLHVHGHVLDPDEATVPRVHPDTRVAASRPSHRQSTFSARTRARSSSWISCSKRSGSVEPLVGRVAEYGLDLGADVQGLRARIVLQVDVRDERKLLDERAVAELGGAKSRPPYRCSR